MAFTDLNFLSRFLPVFIMIYYLVPRQFQMVVLFIGSMIFYAMGNLMFLPVLVILCALNYMFPLLLDVAKKRDWNRQYVLAFAVGIDAMTLVVFKILMALHIVGLPLGISFYIFKMISYQVDVYRGEIEHPKNPLVTATYFTLFFQIAQGPIMRYDAKAFPRDGHKMFIVNLEKGLKFVIIGLVMKIMIADKLAILWNEVTKIGYESISTGLAWLAAIGYSMQLYMDFWGYSLIAAGIGMMLGFQFVTNFVHPYAAASISDFFRRWHVTLTSWFKDYVYIPLGGSRISSERTAFNIAVVWLLTGFWHGNGWNFVMWGVVLCLLILWEKFVMIKPLERFPIIGHLDVWVLIPMTWVIFAAGSVKRAVVFLGRMVPVLGHPQGADPKDLPHYLMLFLPYIIAAIVLCVPVVYEWILKKRKAKARLVESAILVVLLWIALYQTNASASNPFLYVNF